MGPNQTYKLLHSEENHKQNERTTYGLGENVANDTANKAFAPPTRRVHGHSRV